MSSAGYALAKHVFDAIEEIPFALFFAAPSRFELLFRQRVGQLFEQLALFFRHLLRRADLNRRKQIAAASAAHIRHALAAEPQRRSRLRPFGHFHHFRLLERRNLNFTAERDGGEVHLHLAVQIVPVPPEELMLLDLDDDIQVPGRAARGPCFALALEAQLLTGCDAGRNLHRDLAFPRHTAGAAARRARPGDDLAVPATLRARLRDREEALLPAYLPVATTHRACGCRGSRSSAGSMAGLALFLTGNLDDRLGPVRRLFEGNLEVVAQIGAALWSPSATAAKQVAETEHVSEDVGEVAELGEHVR